MSTPGSSSTLSPKAKRVICPKVWKRPHSTIYGKNVEFGSSLYSDKIGELNGRKFNSELPWQARNSGSTSSSLGHQYNQGYLSNLFLIDDKLDSKSRKSYGSFSEQNSYEQLLDITNPSRYSSSNRLLFPIGHTEPARWPASGSSSGSKSTKIDFYAQFMNDFDSDINSFNERTNFMIQSEPNLCGSGSRNYSLNFNNEMGLFLPSNSIVSSSKRSLISPSNDVTSNSSSSSSSKALPFSSWHDHHHGLNDDKFRITDINQGRQCSNFALSNLDTKTYGSPYGQSLDGRKLSLTSINPQSYRPSLPQKTSTVSASDGEEFELQDKSSPFYTDRWAGKTIRHFDSDLYSNANLFKSMIL